MEVFKNSVGRPSNETLKKRRNIKILIAVLIIAIIAGGIYYVQKAFNKDDISGSGKNATAVTITYSGYNTTNPKLGQKVTFKHTVSNMGTKTYYEKWGVFQDGVATNTSSKCTAIKPTNGKYVEEDYIVSPESSGVVKYMRSIIYSDKDCKREVTRKDSTKLKWGGDTKAVTITFSGYNTTSPKLGTKVTFSHSIQNAQNKYQRWFVYEGSSITSQGKCTKITSNSYKESDSLSSPSTTGKKKYLKIVVYSDSSCKNVLATKSSNTITWGSGSSGSGSSAKVDKSKITYTLSPTSMTTKKSNGDTVYVYNKATDIKVTVKNNNSKKIYYLWRTYDSNGTNTTINYINDSIKNWVNPNGGTKISTFKQTANTKIPYRMVELSVYDENGNYIDRKTFWTMYSTIQKEPNKVTIKCYDSVDNLISQIQSSKQFYCKPESDEYNASFTTYTYSISNPENRMYKVNGTTTSKTGSQLITQSDGGTKSTQTKQWFYVYGKAGTSITVKVTMKNKGSTKSVEATKTIKIIDDTSAPYISKACVKYSGGNPYVYIEVADQYKVKQVAWATSASQCKKLASSAITSANVKEFKGNINKKIDTTSGIVACAWDNNNRLNTKSVAKSC